MLVKAALGPVSRDSVSKRRVLHHSRGGIEFHEGLDVALNLVLFPLEFCPRFFAFKDFFSLEKTVCWLVVLLRDSCQDVDTLFVDFNLVLVSQFSKVALHFFVQLAELPVQIFLLAKSALEHSDLIAQLVVLKLVLVSFASYFLIAFFPQFLELSLFALLQNRDYVPCFVKL